MESNENNVIEEQIEVYQDGEKLFVVLDKDKNIVTENDSTAMYYQVVKEGENLEYIGEPELINKEVSIPPVEEEKIAETTEITKEISQEEVAVEVVTEEVENSELTKLKIQLESLEKGTSEYHNCLVAIQVAYLNTITSQTTALTTVYKSNQLDKESYADDLMYAQNLLLEFKEYSEEYEKEIQKSLEASRSAVIGKNVYQPIIKLNPEKVLRDIDQYV